MPKLVNWQQLRQAKGEAATASSGSAGARETLPICARSLSSYRPSLCPSVCLALRAQLTHSLARFGPLVCLVSRQFIMAAGQL